MPHSPHLITNADIARAWHMSRERVRQIEASALRKLRDGLIASLTTNLSPELLAWLNEHTLHFPRPMTPPTPPTPIKGRFGVIHRSHVDSDDSARTWAVAEIVGPTGLWIHHGHYLTKEDATAAAFRYAQKDSLNSEKPA